MTYLDLITDAYRLRNVIDENETPSAEQGVAGARIFNQLMAVWLADGIDLQYIPIEAAGLSDTLTLPDFAEMGVTASLAVRLMQGGPITPELQAQSDSGYDTILREAVKAKLTTQNMEHVPRGEGSRRFWPIW